MRFQGDSRRLPARPSDVAAGRLREQLRREVADLRIRLEEVALRSEVHERIGNLDAVEAAFEEQELMLSQFERRVQHRIVDAIVEREAESILDQAVLALGDQGADVGAFAWQDERSPGGAGRFVRTVAAAAAAALAAMFMATSGTAGVDPVSSVATTQADLSGPSAQGTSATTSEPSSATDGRVLGQRSESATERPSIRERIEQRRQASDRSDRSGGDEVAFLEHLLNRILGAVASVTATPLPILEDAATVSEVPDVDAEQDVALLRVEQDDAAETDSGEGTDADEADATPTEEPTDDGADEQTVTDADTQDEAADGTEDDGGDRGGLTNWSSPGSGISGAGLNGWN
jgi:hypothetical protein